MYLQSWPQVVGAPSLLRAKTHDFNYVLKAIEKKRIEASIIDPLPLAMLKENEPILLEDYIGCG